ncbi:MAG: hypothetical protein Q8R53_04080 [Nanoarchaeota archaeon]|nr:hypothetical protein [Nanoarchaeota archaeon]
MGKKKPSLEASASHHTAVNQHLFTVSISLLVVIALVSVLFAIAPESVGSAITGGTTHIGSPQVTLYAQVDYGAGNFLVFTANAPTLNILDNYASSIKVAGGGIAVILYELENYGGKSLTVTADIPSLVPFVVEGGTTWDNRVSSLKIVETACDPADGRDDDNDGAQDCSDSDCWGTAVCQEKTCSAGKVVTWSYELPMDQQLLDSSEAPSVIGCCAANQCVLSNGNCADFGPTVPSGGSRICDIDQNRYACSPDQDAARSQDGKYECDGSASKWEVRCFADTKYWLNEDKSQICDGNRFLTWNEWQQDKLYNPNVLVSKPGSDIIVKEHNCNNGADDDNDGKTDAEDAADCTNPSHYNLRNTAQFQVQIKDGDGFKVNTTSFLEVTNVLGLKVLSLNNTWVCDPGFDLETATICYTKDGNKKAVIDSLTKLNRIGEKPKYADGNLAATSTVFLYEEPTTASTKKAVRITLVRNLIETALEFPFNTFAANILAGQQLVLVLDGEFYLLSYDTTQELFSSQYLRLQHLPTKTAYTGVNYPGSNWYLFSVLGGKKIAVGTFGSKFLISALEPGEEPAAYVIPWNLAEQYEVKFTKNTPVEITDPAAVGQLTVCQNDNPRDREQIKVCRDNDLEVTLQRGQLKRWTFDGVLSPFALLFDIIPNTMVKQVSIFSLSSLSSTEKELNYDNFIDNMVAGRRVALEFPNGQLYLLQHPIADFLSLPSLMLTDGTTAVTASGSETEVELLPPSLAVGKIFLNRQYGSPPPPFQIKALRSEEVEPINLPQQLFTSFSSTGQAIFIEPTIGTVKVAGDDRSLYQPTFKITADGVSHTLQFGVPYEGVAGNTLIYYNYAEFAGTTPVKKALIYQFYDVSTAAKQHDFTDDFIRVFTGGRELALKLGSSYYLLGHEGDPRGVLFYNPNRLILRTLDRTQTFPVRVIGEVARFEVTEDRIEVEVDIDAGLITFRKRKAFEPLTREEFAKPYWAELTTTNSVNLGGTILRMCYVSGYVASSAAKVCSDDDTLPAVGVLVDPATVVTIGGEKYVIESNGQTGANKRVFIRKLIPLNPDTPFTADDWLAFTTEIVENRKPVFNISNLFFLPQATDTQLQNFGFAPYAGGTTERSRNVREITPISFNGSIFLGDTLIFLTQAETADEEKPINATISVRPYQYLPDNREKLEVELTEGVPTYSLLFVSTIEGGVYRLGTTPLTNQLSWIVLQRLGETEPLFAKSFAAGDIKRLTLDGIPVEIKLESIGDEEAEDATKPTVTVKRSG